MSKTCTLCGASKPLSAFRVEDRPYRQQRSGFTVVHRVHHNACKSCEYRREGKRAMSRRRTLPGVFPWL